MKFKDFKHRVMVSMEDICRDIFHENRASVKIKKEGVVVKNLVNIFNATLKLSNEKGFQAMSLRDLCRETGLSTGALYSYFSTKDELLEIIQDQGRRIALNVLSEYIQKETLPKKKLEVAVRAHLYLSEVMQAWFFFSYMETRHFRKTEHKKALDSELYTEKLFIDIIEEGIRQQIFSSVDPILTASVIKAALQDWYLKRWKYSRRKISVEHYARFIIDFTESFVLAKD